ncbi:DUF7504 family protein [Halorientalis regularis]|uniref:RecA-superfamily ATPase, KaiC/GvpD/RAD55 family n=1 Tax=Halorientalis regularis TaxID=660518 RepID=A0A1G7SHF3_9EURY|nr:hypothetical protein [Halorientalis regularis]SDG21650.1 hypothetical protein SAMN05216218_11843 [Halorientalis regularis]
MSLSTGSGFTADSLGLDPIDDGTSVLLTGEDSDALEAVFYRLTAPRDDEKAVLLATDADGRSVKQSLGRAERGADDRAAVLTCAGPAQGDDVRTVEDVSDLTGLGMQFSTLLAEATGEVDDFRAGILLCSTIMSEVEDTRSVYRFLNSNFLSELRRSKALGVCAVDTSADIGSDVTSTITGMKTSFSAHVEVESAGRNRATLDVSGLPGNDGTVDVSW